LNLFEAVYTKMVVFLIKTFLRSMDRWTFEQQKASSLLSLKNASIAPNP